MKKSAILALLLATPFLLANSQCDGTPVKNEQAQRAKEAASQIRFGENAEIDNIKRRLELTSQPGLLGFVVLLNEAGQPIMHVGVRGKITSGSKRLTEPDRASAAWGGGNNTVVRLAPSDEGTWGSSSEYVFFWTVDGNYIQWNGKYLYSDKPFRLNVEPLVVAVK